MNQLCGNNVQFSLRRNIQRHISIIRGCILHLWNQIRVCSLRNPIRYSMLSHPTAVTNPPCTEPNASPSAAAIDGGGFASGSATPMFHSHHDNDSDLVALKISLLGDCQIGKTSFLAKYVGNEKNEGRTQKNGLNLMDKTLMVKGARISYSIWEVQGDEGSQQQIPMACKDSIAILIMFDLTSRVTLNGVIKWYREARKWNQTAIPIIVGTKFDDFIQLPIDLQWTIASQARAYAKALHATLFFSSATYNINVNKIFKFITAKFFDLPWTPERNLTIGEPIIDF